MPQNLKKKDEPEVLTKSTNKKKKRELSRKVGVTARFLNEIYGKEHQIPEVKAKEWFREIDATCQIMKEERTAKAKVTRAAVAEEKSTDEAEVARVVAATEQVN